VLTSIRLPDSEVGHLLDDRSKLSHLLTSGNELLEQLPAQPCLFGKAVPSILLLAKELGFPTATHHKRLQKDTDQRCEKRKQGKDESTNMSYLASWSNDVL
jgi:hypothetical protein